MARRKQEAQLQQEIETQEEWEDMLSKEGLFGKNFNNLHFPQIISFTFQFCIPDQQLHRSHGQSRLKEFN